VGIWKKEKILDENINKSKANRRQEKTMIAPKFGKMFRLNDTKILKIYTNKIVSL